jgi:uroporphyrinogen-III decarboxylase
MYESPATPLDAVIEHFGAPGRFFIGGISTRMLALGSPQEVREMVTGLYERAAQHPGFAMASGGGLHGDLPLENLAAYFDARADVGASPRSWRSLGRERAAALLARAGDTEEADARLG